MGNLQNKTLALLFKWNWRFLKERDSLWCKIVKSIHGVDPPSHVAYLWEAQFKPESPWISISKTWMKFGSLATFKLGNGNNIFFWLDLWCSGHSFKESFPHLYRIATLPKGSISDHWDLEIRSWNLLFQRPLKDEELAEFQQLLGYLEGKQPSQTPDSRLWSLDSSGKLSVKSLPKHLNASSPLDKGAFSGPLEDKKLEENKHSGLDPNIWVT